MAKFTIENIESLTPRIDKDRNYWFVRTNGGLYYQDFLKNNFIAINYNEITLDTLKNAERDPKKGYDDLISIIKKTYKGIKRPGYVASQLSSFCYGITKGDIVVIPSDSTKHVSFGEVLETPVYLNTVKASDNDIKRCPYFKRKHIRWLQTIPRESLDPKLYQFTWSHHAVSQNVLYNQYIDKILNNFFIKGETGHLVLRVQKTQDIGMRDLFELGALLSEVHVEIGEQQGWKIDPDDVKVKINVQSDGFIELSGVMISAIVLLGLIIVGAAGGGFNWKSKQKDGDQTLDVGLKTDGIIEKIRQYKLSSTRNKTKMNLIEKHMNNLQIEDPKDLIEILKQIDEKDKPR